MKLINPRVRVRLLNTVADRLRTLSDVIVRVEVRAQDFGDWLETTAHNLNTRADSIDPVLRRIRAEAAHAARLHARFEANTAQQHLEAGKLYPWSRDPEGEPRPGSMD